MSVTVERSPILGLIVLRVPVHEDSRGWFKENWQRETMTAAGLPDFGPVQHNLSFNAHRGATRGIHAEPWDKLVSVAHGRVFGAWVDLRRGESFGTAYWLELDPSLLVFVPRGVANSYQALEDDAIFSYLVNAHWRPGVTYPAVHLGDPDAAIPWPIPLDQAEISEKDQDNPLLAGVTPIEPLKTLILGCHGQLGRALAEAYPEADAVGTDELDLTDPAQIASWPWHEYSLVLNAAAYTAVDAAETEAGRRIAWAVNAAAPARLARIATEHRLTLVHYSSDYVYDGAVPRHTEDEPLAPLGVYAQTKAAGDLAVGTAPRHYVVRTSWVIGDGPNFVRTMRRLAREGAGPAVVDDQIGRLTFTDELARATRHLVDTGAAYGVYHVTNGGDPASWAAWAAEVFARSGRSTNDIVPITTAEWAAGKRGIAPRPLNSTLDLAKLEATGFTPTGAREALTRYLESDGD